MFKPTSPAVNFPELESKILQFWFSNGIVQKYLNKNSKSKKTYSFLDGPITANNPMGVHHAWGRTYKDLWQRYHTMRGYKQRYQNGFDCQGLWVEVEVEKELGFRNKKDIEKYGIANFVEKCKERVRKFAAIQTEQSKHLGYFMDWENSYFTMSDENNYMIWHFLKVCHEKDWIYKGHESVPWCPRCETAISQHEMLTEDYKEVTHESVYLEFPVHNKKNEFLLVWTTTPWTIPANVAVAVDKNIEYFLVEGLSGFRFWVAKDLVNKVFKGKYKSIVKTVKGKALVGLKYSTPFDDLPSVIKVEKKNQDKFHIVIETDDRIMPISTLEGTGLVHTAVSAGTQDFKLGKKLGLPMIPVIADDASYLPTMGEFSGKNAKKNPRIIIDYILKWVFEIENYKHRYPACWRCKTELVWKVADEWYIAMDIKDPSDGKTFRQKMQKVAKSIKWIPEFGLERELDWLSNMQDWLISKKNRYWGLALPIYECKTCNSFEVIGSKSELELRAVEGWKIFDGKSPHKPYIDEVKIKCKKCNSVINRISDVGNPWLDAGIVPFSTISENNKGEPLYTKDKNIWKSWFPPDFITESFPGQFKNWFYALIAMSAALENKNPFKTVLGFATLLSESGKPMHKSSGNMIEFNQGAKIIGVDVMRWMYVRQNPEVNLLFGFKVADEVRRKFHLIIWNTYNFFVTYANLNNFSNSNTTAKSSNILDKWILSRLNNLILLVTKSLSSYDAFTASLYIEQFVNDLSTWFIRRSRGRVSHDASNEDREQCLNTLYQVLVTLSKLLAPMLPFITEEIYKNLTDEESIHLSNWPEYSEKSLDPGLEKQMGDIRRFVEVFHSIRKENNIKLRIPVMDASYKRDLPFSKELEKILKDELNIKKVDFIKSTGSDDKIWQVDLNENNLNRQEGEAREIVRTVQNLRKKSNFGLNDNIKLVLPNWPKAYKDYIKEKTLAVEIVKGTAIEIKQV